MEIKIPVYQPSLTGNEKKYVIDCIDSTWISSKGKYIQAFESSFSEYIDVKHSIAVCNGTVALHLAMITLGIQPGDEVIVPTLTYIASVNAIAYVGATPVFVDSLPDTWQMDPADVRKKITSKTKAIMVVHLYGHPCEMEELSAIAKEHELFLVEDCAEAFGSYYKGKHVGSFADISTFSFFGNKTITTGEGGMVVTNDDTLHTRAVRFKGQGLAMHREYWHDIIGYNFRMTNIAAAIGLAQLEQADVFLNNKKKIAQWYQQQLQHLPVTFHHQSEETVHSYWMCSILTQKVEDRDLLRAKLTKAGIETRPVFYPVHTMPMYSAKYQKHKNAEDIGWRGINLPSFQDLQYDQVKYICSQIQEYYSI